MSRVIIVHRWGGNSGSDWIPWLADELRTRDIEVAVPDMPKTNEPEIALWIPYLASVVKEVNEDTFFVGHSVGCQAIMRYLQELSSDKKIGGAVFVAGFVNLKEQGQGEEQKVKEWLETPINWPNVKAHTSSFVYIYSDNDPFVPESDAQIFREKLNAKLVLDEGKGHFTAGGGVTELTTALDELLLIMGLPVETRST